MAEQILGIAINIINVLCSLRLNDKNEKKLKINECLIGSFCVFFIRCDFNELTQR